MNQQDCRELMRGILQGVATKHRSVVIAMMRSRMKRAGRWKFAALLRFMQYLLACQSIERIRIPNVRFDIDKMNDEECMHDFRFTADEIRELVTGFRLPSTIICIERTRSTDIEGMCILLSRLAYPVRWNSMSRVFGRSPSCMSNIFYHVLEHINTQCGVILYGNLDYISLKLHEFSNAIASKGAELHNVWGFVDGTIRGIYRSKDGLIQRATYSGHKRVNGVKFKAL
jgi:hypothetical protein